MAANSAHGTEDQLTGHSLPYLANCSLLFTEEPLLRRPAAAAAYAGVHVRGSLREMEARLTPSRTPATWR